MTDERFFKIITKMNWAIDNDYERIRISLMNCEYCSQDELTPLKGMFFEKQLELESHVEEFFPDLPLGGDDSFRDLLSHVIGCSCTPSTFRVNFDNTGEQLRVCYESWEKAGGVPESFAYCFNDIDSFGCNPAEKIEYILPKGIDSYPELKIEGRPMVSEFQKNALEVANLVEEKQAAYGNSFGKSGECLRQMYPNGIKPEQYDDLLTIARILDKLFRIANDKEAFEEDPWRDILGYSLLSMTKGGK